MSDTRKKYTRVFFHLLADELNTPVHEHILSIETKKTIISMQQDGDFLVYLHLKKQRLLTSLLKVINMRERWLQDSNEAIKKHLERVESGSFYLNSEVYENMNGPELLWPKIEKPKTEEQKIKERIATRDRVRKYRAKHAGEPRKDLQSEGAKLKSKKRVEKHRATHVSEKKKHRATYMTAKEEKMYWRYMANPFIQVEDGDIDFLKGEGHLNIDDFPEFKKMTEDIKDGKYDFIKTKKLPE
jgi:hypothetical protein